MKKFFYFNSETKLELHYQFLLLVTTIKKFRMDKETVNYIINYFSKLMTDDEKAALKYHILMYKSSDNPKMRDVMSKKGWINSSPEIINFLKDGYEEFELNVVKRIMSETPEKVFFNNCPKCNKLARTPNAKQCRYCTYSWHDLV